MTTQLNAWKIFLRGRIHQEKHQFEEALSLFDEALKIDPNNPSFIKARFIATTSVLNLNMAQKIQIDEITKEYEALGKSLTGDHDIPEVWVKELSSLLNKIDEVENAPRLKSIAGVSIAW
jgi:hypothetical protein